MLSSTAEATVQHPDPSMMALGPEPEPTEPAEPTEAPEAKGPVVRLPWHVEVSLLLSRAAALCGEHGIDIDSFTSGAWAAYVEATPGMRDQLEELQLRKQLDELRQHGRLPSA